MEFQLPYFALRQPLQPPVQDGRILFGKDLRNFKPMLTSFARGSSNALFYEAQVSFLLVGVDEWYWTAYCCTDTFFGSERTPTWYKDDLRDGPTAIADVDMPFWNPREYFLHVLSRRLGQVAAEWRNLIQRLEYCLEADVRLPVAMRIDLVVTEARLSRKTTIMIASTLMIFSKTKISSEPGITTKHCP